MSNKTVNFDIWDRVMIAEILGGSPVPNASAMRKIIRVLDLIEVSDEEKVAAGWTEVQPGVVNWKNECPADIVFEGNILVYLKKRIVDHTESGGWKGLHSKRAYKLLDKLGYEWPKDPDEELPEIGK
jgi:hypothetical protein